MKNEVDSVNRPITFAICGFGNRGREAYAAYQKARPEQMRVVAVADPRPELRELARRDFGVASDMCFESGEELLARPRLADVLIVATQDSDHIRFALPGLDRGYHILLEKPISPKLDECVALRERAHERRRMVAVCHVLRYTPFYRAIHRLLEEGAIGRLECVQASENVAYWHFAHSFVRGAWRRQDESSPLILAKSCHDMDMIRWLVGKPCLRVSSYGSLDWFREENAPAGSAARCLDCPVKDCPYDARAIYFDAPRTGIRAGRTGWPCSVLAPEPTEEKVRQALRSGPYGRCVYRCDNDVADHQVVNMEFDGGVTASFTLSAFTQECYRTIRLTGTMGEIEGDMAAKTVALRRFGRPEERIPLEEVDDRFAGHGGGDFRLMEELCALVDQGGGEALTSVDASVESHVMALAAEESRLHHGRSIDLAEFVQTAEKEAAK